MVTALWDVYLRFLAEGRTTLLGVETMKWVTGLKMYFAEHTVVAAATIAGSVGAFTAALTEYLFGDMPLGLYFMGLITLSGVVGIPMRYSNLFPYLKRHYYDHLGFVYSYLADTFSGAVVALSIYALRRLAYSKII